MGFITEFFGNKNKDNTPIICEFCSKELGLNRYLIGKTETGKMLWKCPECAKKGGYQKIVGEKAYLCTKDGEIIETENYNKEIRVKCNTCGHLYCYTKSDLEKNEKLMKSALVERTLAVGNSFAGSMLVGSANTSRADNLESQIIDYKKCPNCHSTDIRKLEDSEWEQIKNQQNINNTMSSADELKKFKELLDSGIITQEEFDAKKRQLLGL